MSAATNKITVVVNALETAFNQLVSADGTGVLKAVVRGVVNPMTLSPAKRSLLALSATQLKRLGRTGWESTVIMQLVGAKGASDMDEAAIQLVAAVQAKFDSTVGAGTAIGGVLNQPEWNPVYFEESAGSLTLIQIVGTATLRVTDPLLIPAT